MRHHIGSSPSYLEDESNHSEDNEMNDYEGENDFGNNTVERSNSIINRKKINKASNNNAIDND
jgi:hypothetical protein